MDKRELVKAIVILEGIYKDFRISNDESILAIWHNIFKDDDVELFQEGVKAYISKNKFSPTPAGIKEYMTKIIGFSGLSSADAWNYVKKAISSYGIYQQEKAMEYLKEKDENLYKTVKGLNFKELCLSENEMADRAHFMKMYNQLTNREKEQSLLPQSVVNKSLEYKESRNLIGELTEKFLIEGGN